MHTKAYTHLAIMRGTPAPLVIQLKRAVRVRVCVCVYFRSLSKA